MVLPTAQEIRDKVKARQQDSSDSDSECGGIDIDPFNMVTADDATTWDGTVKEEIKRVKAKQPTAEDIRNKVKAKLQDSSDSDDDGNAEGDGIDLDPFNMVTADDATTWDGTCTGKVAQQPIKKSSAEESKAKAEAIRNKVKAKLEDSSDSDSGSDGGVVYDDPFNMVTGDDATTWDGTVNEKPKQAT